MKKKILIAGSVLLVLLLSALLFLFFKGRGNQPIEHSDSDCTYPYTLTAVKDGSILVKIYGGMSGYEWRASSENSLAAVPSEETSKKEDTVCFRLRPVLPGSTTLTFTLAAPDNAADTLYQIFVKVKTTGNALSFESSGHKELSGLIRSADGKYTIAQEDAGTYLVTMLAGSGADWVPSVVSGSASVRFVSAQTEESQFDSIADPEGESEASENAESEFEEKASICSEMRFRISGTLPEDFTVRISDEENLQALELCFSYSEAMELKLISNEMKALEPKSETEMLWGLFDVSPLCEESTEVVSTVSGETAEAELAAFSAIGQFWEMVRCEKLPYRELIDQESIADSEAIAENGVLYGKSDGLLCAVWEKDGYAYRLKAFFETDLPIGEFEAFVQALTGDAENEQGSA